MLSLLKKKSNAAAPPSVPAWHPNFRNYEKLPDIKVVRTAFFINIAAISVALALAIYFGFHEWQLRVVGGQVTDVEKRIRTDKPLSEQAVVLYKKFQAEEAKIAEVDGFIKSRPLVSELLRHIGETIPPNVALDTFDLRDTGLVLRLSVRGAPDAAAGHATAYLNQLKGDQKMMVLFADAAMTSLTRNPATGRLAVEMTLPLKPAGGKKP
ncbi:MAG: hypothetical protein Q7S40_05635 [Opitutaceae bacterium]|nr:hypothetical protein [Opitutaceae bacterium]